MWCCYRSNLPSKIKAIPEITLCIDVGIIITGDHSRISDVQLPFLAVSLCIQEQQFVDILTKFYSP